jgi:hypothetical protein
VRVPQTLKGRLCSGSASDPIGKIYHIRPREPACFS